MRVSLEEILPLIQVWIFISPTHLKHFIINDVILVYPLHSQSRTYNRRIREIPSVNDALPYENEMPFFLQLYF